MHLTAIRLAGFKSFADNTTFPVDAPVTGIIGPNGCGKSNIIDAVRWVLGETAAKQLRGQAMTDIIFAGAANRRAAGMASVALHFDNSDGSAGGAFADYAELVIARKVGSDGQSQYLINNKRVRRRDIVELLQGTGVGARSYAVIEQGMISRIIEAKPEELRSYIEEAAGIAHYKTRRKESEARMNDVREHLTRHDDRLQQLGKQRDKLAQEAATARQWRDLNQQQQHLAHRLQSWQYHQTQRQLDAAQTQYQEDRAALEDLFAHSGIDETRLAALEQQHTAAKEAHKNAENAALQSAAQLAQLRRTLETDRQSQQHLAQNAREHETRLARLRQQSGEDHDQQQQHRSEIARLEAQLTAERPAHDSARAALDSARAATETLRHKLDAARETRHHAENRHYTAEHRLHDAENQYRRLEQRRAEPVEPTGEDDNEPGETLALEQETLAIALETTAETLAAAADAVETAQAAYDHGEQQLRQQHTQRERQQTELDTLRRLQPPPAADGGAPGVPHLGDHLRVEPAWQTAIGRHLGDRLHASIGAAHWQHALTHGHPQLSGGGVPAAWQPYLASDADLHPWLGHLQPLAKHDRDIQPDDLADGIQYLTLDGSSISRSSVQPAPAADDRLARQNRINTLEAALAAGETALRTLETAHQAHRDTLAAATARLDTLRQQHQQQKQQQHDLAHRLALSRQQQQHRATLRAQQQRAAATLAEDIAAAAQNLAQAQEEHRQAQRALAALPPIHELENEYRALHAHYQQTARTAQQHEENRRAAETALEQHRAHLAAGEKQQTRLAEDIAASETALATLHEQLETLALTLEENHLSLETHEQTHAANEQQRAEAAQALEKTAHELHHEQEARRERDHRRQLAEERLQHHQQQIEQLHQQQQRIIAELLSDNHEPLPEAAEDEAALNADIRALKQQKEALGAVNLAAITDYDSAENEYSALAAQCRDLRDTLALLAEAIDKLDDETRSRLQETLDIVNRHFANLFPILFRGGEAELAWTEGDILDAGITIAVRPPGKKVKNLSVLSGGEKALTALALVFALFRLNPAPFCLLDEVDAPLDDANVGRLSNLLRDMAAQTQFIVITHRKRTMQTCDHLIGVTMSEPGVSRLVAVQFAE
ncbi:AAA family ATPase [uncultured Cardiobacterium sp.]|uniref:AAA family ATPase n=1 Tax=uncultured Cardiobacterium sp. TaxID=417619 RepID=UPI002611C79C|nr:AAA family ATPase [uncultured Cardiobacterium sp.]